jgi:hypothetical protein
MATATPVPRASPSAAATLQAAPGLKARATAARIGTLSAILLAILNVWFWIAFVLYEPVLQATWRGMADYQGRFQPAMYLAWVVPAFLIAPAFLAMITCIHAWSDEDHRTWSLLAAAFAVPGATLMAALYYIQMTVVPNGLTNGNADALRLWIYAPPYPFTFPGALEGVGYGFEAAAFLLAAQAFAGHGLRSWVRWLFRAAGLSAMVVLVDPVIRLPVPLVLGDGGLAMLLLTASPALLAVLWWRSEAGAPSGLNQDVASGSRVRPSPTSGFLRTHR